MHLLTEQPQPSDFTILVASCTPAEGACDVAANAVITATLQFARGEIVSDTVNDSTVMLIRTGDQTPVPVSVKCQSKTITVRPDEPLRSATNYTVVINSGVRHVSGASVVAWASSFTTINDAHHDVR